MTTTGSRGTRRGVMRRALLAGVGAAAMMSFMPHAFADVSGTLVLLDWASGSEQDMIKALEDGFVKANPGVNFKEINLTVQGDARGALRAALQSGEKADIFINTWPAFRKELADAVVGNDPARVRWLLDHGADPDKVVELEYNALQWAVREGHLEIARILLGHGAGVDVRDSDGWSPLMTAVWRDNPAMIRLLIDKGAKLDDYDSKGWNPLSVAITYGGLDLVERLITAGANVNAANEAGYTPIMFATAKSADGVLDLLIRHGADVRAANKAGITSLMLAAAENNDASVKRLLAAGADPAARDSKGQSALDIAREKGNSEVAALLSKPS